MTDFLIQATLSNLVVATILAVIAWVVERRVRSASLANLLWAMVLIKLVTPPIFSLPVLEVPRVSQVSPHSTGLPNELPDQTFATEVLTEVPPSTAPESTTGGTSSHSVPSNLWTHLSQFAICIWISVSAMLIVVSAFRILRFHWLLKANSRTHRDLSLRVGAPIANQMGVRRSPHIVVSRANVAPFVWWRAGRPIIVISEQAIQQLSDGDLRLVISHEIAHIKRRDHWFRWLEWTALTCLWWNPVMWWARKQLRNSEEIACDNLVLQLTNPDIHQYAHSLLNMAELLTATAIRPPIVASAIDSGGNLEERLELMIANKTREIPTWLRGVVCAGAICLLPVGLVYAQDFDAVERRLGGAVQAGELSLEQARVMMEALRSTAGSKQSHHDDMEARKKRYMAIAKKIAGAVEAGKVSKEEAEKKLIEIRTEMFRNPGNKKKEAGNVKSTDREMEARKRRYMAVAKEIKAAVEAGKLSKEDAEQKLIAIRMEMFRNPGERKKEAYSVKGADREMEARKQRYMAVAKEIEAAVEAGRLSKEDAEKKLIEVRRGMFEQKPADERARETEAAQKRFEQVTRRIRAAIESGDISPEEGRKKLMELRKESFDDGK